MKKRWLRFVLLEDCSFTDLLTKIAKAFNVELSVEDDEGRYVAKGDFSFYSIELVDRFDRLSDLLCDDKYTFDIIITSDDYFNSSFEHSIKKILDKNSIKWERTIWAPQSLPNC